MYVVCSPFHNMYIRIQELVDLVNCERQMHVGCGAPDTRVTRLLIDLMYYYSEMEPILLDIFFCIDEDHLCSRIDSVLSFDYELKRENKKFIYELVLVRTYVFIYVFRLYLF